MATHSIDKKISVPDALKAGHDSATIDEFHVAPSERSLEREIEDLLKSDQATRADMAVALHKLQATEKSLLGSMQRFDNLVSNIPDGVYIWSFRADGSMGFDYVSRKFCEILGLEAQAVIKDHTLAFSAVHPDDKESLIDANRQAGITMKPFRWEGRFIVRGETRWIRISSEPTRLPNGGSEWNGIVSDMTEHKDAEALLAESEEQYRLLISAMEEGVTLQDENSAILAFNKSAEEILGLSADQLRGKTSFDPNWYAIHEDGSPFPGETHPVVKTLKTGKPQSNVIMGIHKPDGTLTWISVNVQPIFKEGRANPYRAVATMHDITERKLAQEHVKRLAYFDQLTDLPNRALLKDRFQFVLDLAERSGKSFAVMFLDLDLFKDVNDTLGHSVGDQLLVEVTQRLKAALREIDVLSRQGGDEFIVVMPGTDADGATLAASRLIDTVSKPCQIDQHELIITLSIGIAIYPHDGTNFESLSKNADTAMYRAKHEGRNTFRFFTPEMQSRSARNLKLANGLRQSLGRQELELHYQPQFSIQDGRIVGMEALLRWNHPEMGAISPAEFIPVAESTGQIISIGEWVLRTAARQLKRWMEEGMPPMVMAVNLSAVQFRQNDLPDLVSRILDETKLPSSYLELELTEAATMENTQTAIQMIDHLHSRGVSISIDDFGTGYSSLSYLKQFKVNKIKIDQSFVRGITNERDDKALVSAIINMANALGLRTIAEGVETADQLNFLRLLGCHEAQGFYFSKPLAANKFEAFVRKNSPPSGEN